MTRIYFLRENNELTKAVVKSDYIKAGKNITKEMRLKRLLEYNKQWERLKTPTYTDFLEMSGNPVKLVCNGYTNLYMWFGDYRNYCNVQGFIPVDDLLEYLWNMQREWCD